MAVLRDTLCPCETKTGFVLLEAGDERRACDTEGQFDSARGSKYGSQHPVLPHSRHYKVLSSRLASVAELWSLCACPSATTESRWSTAGCSLRRKAVEWELQQLTELRKR